jgi:hypothetical protein
VRVHPTVLRGQNSKNYIVYGAGALVVFLLLINAFPKKEPPAPVEQMKNVVVAKLELDVSKPIPVDRLVVESRPIRYLPVDHITTLEELKGLVPRTQISKGFPLAKSLLIDPKEIKKEEVAKVEPVTLDACSQKIEQLRSQTVVVSVRFPNNPPPKCSNVALTLKVPNGALIPIVENAFIESAQGGNSVRMMVTPDKAMLLQRAVEEGQLLYVEVNEGVMNPIANKTIGSVEELIQIIRPQAAKAADAPPPPEKDNYDICQGWAREGNELICIGKDRRLYKPDKKTGQLVVTGPFGEGQALRNWRTEQRQSEEPKGQRKKEALEMFYPLSNM